MSIHVLTTPGIARPWWRSDERMPDAQGRRLWTDCCCCKRPAEETDCRVVSYYDAPLGGFGQYQEAGPAGPDLGPDLPTGAYYDPDVQVRCAEGFGCTVRPRMRWGRHLRETMRGPA